MEQPGCGWCNDPSNTGRGHCIEGSSRGPMKLVGMLNNEMLLDTSLCPKEKNYEWSFIQCPGNKNILKGILISAQEHQELLSFLIKRFREKNNENETK